MVLPTLKSMHCVRFIVFLDDNLVVVQPHDLRATVATTRGHVVQLDEARSHRRFDVRSRDVGGVDATQHFGVGVEFDDVMRRSNRRQGAVVGFVVIADDRILFDDAQHSVVFVSVGGGVDGVFSRRVIGVGFEAGRRRAVRGEQRRGVDHATSTPRRHDITA